MDENSRKIFLTKKECYCDLFNFFKHVAQKDGYSHTEDRNFDCRKIYISKDVLASIMEYYNSVGYDRDQFSMIFTCYGPKTSLTEFGYSVIVEDGFVY